MPKATFYNIDSEKRERIIEVIIDEFSENTYEAASINQIVKASDIAKGSFYQYFEDKLDIYKMAIEISYKERMGYIEKVNEDEMFLDEFRIMRELCISAIKFEIDKPKLSSIINKFHKISDRKFKAEILEDLDLDLDIKTEFKKVLEKGIENGKIYYNVDVEFMSFLLERISRSTKEYFKIKKQEDKYINYEGFVNTAIDLIENGIKLRRNDNIEDIF